MGGSVEKSGGGTGDREEGGGRGEGEVKGGEGNGGGVGGWREVWERRGGGRGGI